MKAPILVNKAELISIGVASRRHRSIDFSSLRLVFNTTQEG
ncbi:MAG: hypothetical protein RMZ41_010280 [Nostoc sp. DedVER02]